jgi:hypothetical protein
MSEIVKNLTNINNDLNAKILSLNTELEAANTATHDWRVKCESYEAIEKTL